jgi:hypothetical protein
MEGERIWQRLFYDFEIWSERKRIEKLRYMHRNPEARGLVLSSGREAACGWGSFAISGLILGIACSSKI